MTYSETNAVCVKRIYEAPEPADGCRILVDRIWPRGVSKEAAHLDAWFKDVAPTHELRRWFGHDATRWSEFKARYFAELDGQGGVHDRFLTACPSGRLTLLYAAVDIARNNAVALKEYLDGHAGSGP